MIEARPSLYHRHRFPAEITAEAVWLYLRFPLSFRMVEDMLAYRGIIVTHKTVREWAKKFGREYANTIRRSTPRLGDKWHLDEVVITIKGKRHIRWRAVDQGGPNHACRGTLLVDRRSWSTKTNCSVDLRHSLTQFSVCP